LVKQLLHDRTVKLENRLPALLAEWLD
jgi:hypothetical protein